MASISGNVTVTGDPDDWIAVAFDADTHAYADVAAVSAGSYTISGLTAGKAYVVSCRPKTGGVWQADYPLYEVGSYCVPTSPAATPYIYKATESTPGDLYFENNVLLMPMDGSDNGTTFTDVMGKTITRTNAVTKTGTKKFGTASGYFDGNTDYLTVAGSSDFSFGTGDFTFETWLYIPSGGANSFPTIFDNRSTANSAQINIYTNSSRACLLQHNGGTLCQTAAMSADEWHHLALVRYGNSIKFYVDGTGGTAGDATSKSFGGTATGYIGQSYAVGSGTNFYGYLDDLRISKGLARYTGNFSVPTVAHPQYLGLPSGSTEPTWPTSVAATVIDGGVTWTNMGRLIQPLMQGPLIAA